jgi:hypothetical protein
MDVLCVTRYKNLNEMKKEKKKNAISTTTSQYTSSFHRLTPFLIRLQITGHVLSKQWELGGSGRLR